MGITEELISNITQTNFNSLDAETTERAKWRILDAIGVIIAGANASGCNNVVKLVKKWGGAEESTILVHGGKALAHNVAMANSIMMRSYDFEAVEAEGPNMSSSPAHISGSTIPTALAMAEQQGASGQELIIALVLGDDLAARLASSSTMDFTAGWDNTGTVNAFGTTAIASKLLNLNERQVRDAFGIVLNQTAGSIAGVWDKTLAFKLPIALAAKNGIISAELAKEGYPGVKDPIVGNFGFFSIYCKNYNPENLTKDLGKKFYADCAIKPWPCCRATHAPIDIALQIVNNQNLIIDDIDAIKVGLDPGMKFIAGPFIMGETPQIDAAFSLRYTLANALLRKSVKPEHFSEQSINDQGIMNLIDKIIIDYTMKSYNSSEIVITMKNGIVYSAHTDFPKGHIFKNPMTSEEIKAKYKDNALFSKTVPWENAEKACTIIEKLEALSDIRELTSLIKK